ncbi:MAG: RNA methyltransferase [Rickettsiales bacterium]|nr:RNA methyltransferase [Rickettsiales bacterium]
MGSQKRSPAIILVQPQLGENIGAAARVMLNFCLHDLRIVNPRDGWPNEAANYMAAGATSVIEHARIFPDIESACADLSYMLVTTARPRDMEKRVLTPREACAEAFPIFNSQSNIGFIFGPERCGVDNDVIALSDAIISVPVNPEYSSLNLAQAIALLCYEWSLVADDGLTKTSSSPVGAIASKESMLKLYEHIEAELDKRNFYSVPEKKPRIIRNLRTMLGRAKMTDQEVKTFRGMLRSLCER